jgi:AraC-like DNA-binding protein
VSLVAIRVDSALGRFEWTEWRPTHLAGVVDSMWHADGVAETARKRIFPGATLDLVINLGPAFRLVEGAGVDRFESARLSGLQTRPIVIETPGRSCALGVRLRPAGAHALFGISLAGLTDLTVDARDLVGREADVLADRCHAAETAERRFRMVVRWIEDRLARSPACAGAIAWAAARIEASGGRCSIAAIRDAAGLSTTRFVSAFRERVGVSPKRYARLVRFRRALALLGAGGRSLAALALDAGYYDQAHLSAEFREIAGFAPGELLAAPRWSQTQSVAEGSR